MGRRAVALGLVVLAAACSGVAPGEDETTSTKPIEEITATVGASHACAVEGVAAGEPGRFQCVNGSFEERTPVNRTIGDCSASGRRCGHIFGERMPASVLHWNGTAWASDSACLPIEHRGITGGPRGEAWIVGVNDDFGASVYRLDEGNWIEDVRFPGISPDGIWRAPNGIVWVWGSRGPGGRPVVLQRLERGWRDVSPNAPPGAIGGVHGTASGAVWATGTTYSASGIPTSFLCDGAGWHATPVELASGELDSVWMASERDGWAIGWIPYERVVMRWTGRSWRRWMVSQDVEDVLSSDSLGATLYGFAADDVWATGAIHWDGATWTAAYAPQVRAFLRTSRREVFGFAARPACSSPASSDLLRWNGRTWELAGGRLERTLATLRLPMGRVWGLSLDDLWLIESDFSGAC